jgi:hypothetical protein
VTPTAAPSPQVLYVGNNNTPGQVLQFSLPLTPSTTSNFAIASDNVVAVAPDANGNLAVGDNGGHLQFFTAPLSGASTPAATFNNGAASNNGNISFMNTGDFWAATVSNRVNRFNTPFSNASTPAAFVTDAGMVSDIGTALDAAQNLYIANAGTGNAAACAGTSQPGGGCGSNIYVYAPPYTGAPIITPNVINFPFPSNSTAYRKIAVNATRFYAASVANGPGRVDVYNMPITAASVPAFALTTGVNTPEGLALDASGNLYIGNLTDATVTVYSAPITASSVPSLIFKVSSGAFAIFGIGIGPATSPGTTSIFQFDLPVYGVTEGCTSITGHVFRTGLTTGTASVDVTSDDGSAKQKGDYEIVAAHITFAPGETDKTFQILVNDDGYTEGLESATLLLQRPLGGVLGAQNTSSLQIIDNSPETSSNPIDTSSDFVGQHYHDFLYRQADGSGQAFWQGIIDACGVNATCIQNSRVNVSQAFFLSTEFKETGYLVIRAQKAAFGNTKSIPRYINFLRDQHQVADGVIVGQAGWPAQLDANKNSYLMDVVTRPDFVAQFPTGSAAATYVSTLFTNSGATPTTAETNAAISAYGSGDTAGRAAALRSVIESGSVFNKLYNDSIVLMQYYGYLRRNPDDSPDNSFAGYDFWLAKLNSFSLPGEDMRDDTQALGRVQRAQMVQAFITSNEYRQRIFGAPGGNQQGAELAP